VDSFPENERFPLLLKKTGRTFPASARQCKRFLKQNYISTQDTVAQIGYTPLNNLYFFISKPRGNYYKAHLPLIM
jgi:hypothetical protein